MLKSYVAICSDVEKPRFSEAAAREQARILSLALHPEPAEVKKASSPQKRELISFFVDGQEYPPELMSLTRKKVEMAK